ncbi:MAG: bifunctional phosphoglucose/phosphomannose isomerase [Actinobacteria bacterium]|nr:bifunctional phosphoglucose/phosphomannose isomerase [Actinomycetota bacterium]
MTSMRHLIGTLPEQLRWAAGLQPPEVPASSEALVAGMGGSGIAGGIAGVVAAAAGRRVGVHRSYGLPGWAGSAGPLVVVVSHSGDTEESLSAIEAAGQLGLSRAAVTTGGHLAAVAAAEGIPLVVTPGVPQPRAAVGYLTGAVLRLLEAAGVVPPQSAGLNEAAEVVERLLDGGHGAAVALADDLASALYHRLVVVYGAEGVPAVAAYRWKTQINENGKAIAYSSSFPELDHNEIEAWAAYPDLARDRVGVVWLHDPADDPRLKRRAEVSRRLVEGRVGLAGEVHAQGAGPLARLFSLTVVGDLVAVSLAERAGVDPVAVDLIATLKERLAEEAL